MKTFSMRLTSHSSATPDVVYETLADLRTHLKWGGAQQRSDFRLLSLEAPAGLAIAGTSFTSTGSMPMSGRRWEDASTVTVAERPLTFEFVTHSTVRRSKGSMLATYRHRYEIARAEVGSEVTYTFTQEDLVNPFLRLGLPLIRTMTWRMGIPFLAGRGFRNLLAIAAESANRPASVLR